MCAEEFLVGFKMIKTIKLKISCDGKYCNDDCNGLHNIRDIGGWGVTKCKFFQDVHFNCDDGNLIKYPDIEKYSRHEKCISSEIIEEANNNK